MYVVPLAEATSIKFPLLFLTLRVIMYRRVMYTITPENCRAGVISPGNWHWSKLLLRRWIVLLLSTRLIYHTPVWGYSDWLWQAKIIRHWRHQYIWYLSTDGSDCCTLFMPRRPELMQECEKVLEQILLIMKPSWLICSILSTLTLVSVLHISHLKLAARRRTCSCRVYCWLEYLHCSKLLSALLRWCKVRPDV